LRKQPLAVQQYPKEGKHVLRIQFVPVVEPTREIAEAFTRWENDPALIPLSRPNPTKEDLEKRQDVTLDDLAQRLKHQHTYLIYLDEQLIGEMNYQVDPRHLFKQEPGTAWIGITIGEAHGRGKGIGYQSLQYLEQQIIARGLRRIELGVFEFNAPALSLYHKLGYQEIGRISDFTYWQDRLWQDIRMEKYLSA
jgi:RimJ/RimL family protein N-acetyltransferase